MGIAWTQPIHRDTKPVEANMSVENLTQNAATPQAPLSGLDRMLEMARQENIRFKRAHNMPVKIEESPGKSKASCKGCGVSFSKAMAIQAFCDRKCKDKFHSRIAASKPKKHVLHDPKPCVVCGVDFRPKSSRIKRCSQECVDKANLEYGREYRRKYSSKPVPESTSCIICKSTFKPSNLSHQICSDTCRLKRRSDTQRILRAEKAAKVKRS